MNGGQALRGNLSTMNGKRKKGDGQTVCLSLELMTDNKKKISARCTAISHTDGIFNQMVFGAKWCVFFTQLCDDWWTMTTTMDDHNHVIVISNQNYLRSTALHWWQSTRLAVIFICAGNLFYTSYSPVDRTFNRHFHIQLAICGSNNLSIYTQFNAY